MRALRGIGPSGLGLAAFGPVILGLLAKDLYSHQLHALLCIGRALANSNRQTIVATSGQVHILQRHGVIGGRGAKSALAAVWPPPAGTQSSNSLFILGVPGPLSDMRA